MVPVARFLIPGLIIVHYITQTPVPEPMRLELIRYLLNRANAEDGGWGIHIEGISTVFGTALNYVTLRILGLGADHPAMVKARNTLHKLGKDHVIIEPWTSFIQAWIYSRWCYRCSSMGKVLSCCPWCIWMGRNEPCATWIMVRVFWIDMWFYFLLWADMMDVP